VQISIETSHHYLLKINKCFVPDGRVYSINFIWYCLSVVFGRSQVKKKKTVYKRYFHNLKFKKIKEFVYIAQYIQLKMNVISFWNVQLMIMKEKFNQIL